MVTILTIITLVWDVVKTLFSPLTKLLKWIYAKLPFKVVLKRALPKLGIIESSWREHTWEYAKHSDREIITIHTHWHVANTLPYNVTALNVFLTKPIRVKGHALIKHHVSNIWGSYPIPHGYTTEVEASFVLDKKIIRTPQGIIKVNIEFQDSIGHIHKVDKINIHPFIKNLGVKKDILRIEDPSKLQNKVEKEVVAILKNEVQQYKVRGRREGRLGTVEWTKGAIEWRDKEAKIKFLFENSNKSNVSSEHIDALVLLYNSSSVSGKKKILTSVLKRIDKKSEYRDVGYLIIFFLFEINQLEKGLDVSLKKLLGDKANAFSDVLRILDFLLAFRYSEFDNSELDAIERFIYSTKEHSFQIKERINAIKVMKILVRPTVSIASQLHNNN